MKFGIFRLLIVSLVSAGAVNGAALPKELSDVCQMLQKPCQPLKARKNPFRYEVGKFKDGYGRERNGCKVTWPGESCDSRSNYDVKKELQNKGWQRDPQSQADSAGSQKYDLLKNDLVCSVDIGVTEFTQNENGGDEAIGPGVETIICSMR